MVLWLLTGADFVWLALVQGKVVTPVLVLPLFDRSADERSEGHFEQGFELVVSEVGVVDDSFRDEWSLDDVHGHFDVGRGR